MILLTLDGQVSKWEEVKFIVSVLIVKTILQVLHKLNFWRVYMTKRNKRTKVKEKKPNHIRDENGDVRSKPIIIEKNGERIKYYNGFHDVAKDGEQWIRLTDGCFRQCWNCYTPKEVKVYDLPEIRANKVRFLDQNFIYAHHDPVGLINSLPRKLNGKVIRYHFYSGLDFTLFTPELVKAFKKARVGRFNDKGNYINGLAIAWDRKYKEWKQIERAIDMMLNVGYSRRGIQIRILSNGKIGYNECMNKLWFLYTQRVMIDDCWFNNQKRRTAKPIYWTKEEIIKFGDSCRANNVCVMQNQHRGLDRIYEVTYERK